MAITASQARKSLFPLIEQVDDDHTAVEITSERGSAVLMSRADDDALQETAYLLRGAVAGIPRRCGDWRCTRSRSSR